MAVATFTLTGNLPDLFDNPARRSAFVQLDQAVVDTTNDVTYPMADSTPVDGLFSLPGLPAKDALNNGNAAFNLFVTLGKRIWLVPAQTAGSTHDLTEFGEVTAVVPSTPNQFLAIQGLATQVAADAAAVAAVPTTTDGLIAGRVNTPGSATDVALKAAFVNALVMTGSGIDATGAANSTTAMNAKFTTAATLGIPKVAIPPGTYKGDFVIPPPASRVGIKIIGDGIGHTTLKANSASPVLTVGDGSANDAQHVTVNDLTVDGNSVAVDCVRLNCTRFFKMEDVSLVGSTTYGANFLGGVPNYFANFKRVRIFTSGINLMLDGGGAGIGANSNYFEQCHFSGATNVNYNSSGVIVSVAINGGDSNVFRDCEFIAAGTSIYLHNSAVGNKVESNQFDGPTTAVHCASAGVSRTHIVDNTGTVVLVDSGTGTVVRQDALWGAGSQPLIVGGTFTRTNITPLIVKAASGASTDVFRVESSAAAALFRVDQAGNIETGANGAVTAHAHSTFNNANNGSVSMTVDTGPTSSTANIGLRVRHRNSGQTADLVQFQNDVGAMMAAVGPKGTFKTATFTTAGRPSASTSGAGSMYYDTTLSKPAWSDGTVWRDAAGTAV